MRLPHGSGDELELAPSRQVLDYVEKHHAKDFKAPDKREEPSLSSVERYAHEQPPALVKQHTAAFFGNPLLAPPLGMQF